MFSFKDLLGVNLSVKCMTTAPSVEVLIPQKVKSMSTKEIVDMIHGDFFSEYNHILNRSANAPTIPSELMQQAAIAQEKNNILSKFGLTANKKYIHNSAPIREVATIQATQIALKTVEEALLYFKNKYPTYHFITGEAVQRIAKKWNLVIGTADKYTGTIPDENIKHMSQFKLKVEDEAWVQVHSFGWGRDEEREIMSAYSINNISGDVNYRSGNNWSSRNEKLPTLIVAPISDMDTTGMKLEGNILKAIPIPDPILLQPVTYADKTYYAIVTAWGPEASDSEVINPTNN